MVKWKPETTALLMLSLILIGLGLLLLLWPISSSLPLPSSIFVIQSLTGAILIGGGLIVLAAGWRRS